MKCIKKIKGFLTGILIVALFSTCFSVNAEEIVFMGSTSFSVPKIGEYGNGIELKVTRQTQNRSQWCWAACASMVGQYVTGRTYSQSTIVAAVLGNYENIAATPDQVREALSFALGNTSVFCLGTFDFSGIQYYLGRNKPLEIEMQYGIFSHLLIISGLQNPDYVQLIDPSSDSTLDNGKAWVHLPNMLNGMALNGASKMIYTHTYTY